jgi:nucleoside-diphosphate-sugar epimerase
VKILITGSQGYVGSALVAFVNEKYKGIELDGLDLGIFQNLTHFSTGNHDFNFNNLKFKDIRDIDINELENYDAVIHLAAVSNDPIGEKYSKITDEINFKSTIEFAKKIK